MAKNTTSNHHINGSRLGTDGISLNLVNLTTFQVMINCHDWMFIDLIPKGGSFYCKMTITTLTTKTTLLFNLPTTSELAARLRDFKECHRLNRSTAKLLKVDTVVTATETVKLEMKRRGESYVIAVKCGKKQLVFDANLADFVSESMDRTVAAKDTYELRESLCLPKSVQFSDRDGFTYKLEVGHNPYGPFLRITKINTDDINNYILIPYHLLAQVRALLQEAETALEPFERYIGSTAVYKLKTRVSRYCVKIFHDSLRHKREFGFHRSLWDKLARAIKDCEDNAGLQQIYKLTRPKHQKVVVDRSV
ncbi:protein ORF126 [Lake sturgeon herpesvirus]|nr:protein ORF126 [Lake sturgeon herpesvirus]